MPVWEIILIAFIVNIIFMILYFTGVINLQIRGFGPKGSGWYSYKHGWTSRSGDDAFDIAKDMNNENQPKTKD
jgi:hypothetical protein